MGGVGNITSKCYWFEQKIDLKIYVLFESPYQHFISILKVLVPSLQQLLYKNSKVILNKYYLEYCAL